VMAGANAGNGGKSSSSSTLSSKDGKVDLEHAPMQMHNFNATQLQTMIKLYERIQTHVFRLMATDSVPKFIKTSRFMALRNWVEEYEIGESDLPPAHSEDVSIITTSSSIAVPAAPPGLDDPEEVGRAYMSVSSQALGRKKEKEPLTPVAGPGIQLVPTKSIAS